VTRWDKERRTRKPRRRDRRRPMLSPAAAAASQSELNRYHMQRMDARAYLRSLGLWC
jgi:hypothetical protein